MENENFQIDSPEMTEFLTDLRNFAQAKTNTLDWNYYSREPLVQPRDFTSWPWIKKVAFFDQCLGLDRQLANFEKFDINYSPFLWCEQARDEALKFFCEENLLIRVTVHAEEGEDLVPNTILQPLNSLRAPTELLDENMLEDLKDGVTLHLQLGEGCGLKQATQATNVVYDQIFGYNRYMWFQYCQILASNTIRTYPGMTINLHPKYQSNFRDLAPDFLLHLSHMRSVGNVYVPDMMTKPFINTLADAMRTTPTSPWQWQEMLVGLMEESAFLMENDSFDAGYALISRASTVAETALDHATQASEESGLDSEIYALINGTLSLCTDVFILYGCKIPVRLEAHTMDNMYHPGLYVAFEKMFKAVRNARSWPGMTSQQLAASLYITGLFYEHLAGYLETPGNIGVVEENPSFEHGIDIESHRLHAAHCYFAAAKINPAKYGEIAMKRWNDLYENYGNGVAKEEYEVKLQTLKTALGGEWYGWAVMWDFWGYEKLKYLEVTRKTAFVSNSKSQIKKGRNFLGLGNCRKDPPGLLRCLFM